MKPLVHFNFASSKMLNLQAAAAWRSQAAAACKFNILLLAKFNIPRFQMRLWTAGLARGLSGATATARAASRSKPDFAFATIRSRKAAADTVAALPLILK